MKRPTNILRWSLLGATAALLVAHALRFDFVNDDAFISFRYADNLLRHGQLVFNPGERVEGYTNFLWTLLMAGVLGLGGEPVFWSKALGIAFGTATLVVIARFTARCNGADSPADVIGPLWLALAPAFACWCTGGLETQLFTFLVTLGWTSYLLEMRPGHASRPLSGVWFALATMTRPEGMLLFVVTVLHRALSLLLGWTRPVRRDLEWAAGFIVCFGPYFVARWVYYGWPLPNSYYAKAGGGAFWGPGRVYILSWIRDHHLWVVPLFAVIAMRGRGALLVLVGLMTVALGVHVARIGGDFMGLHRFLVPLMPALAVVIGLGARSAWRGIGTSGPRRLALVALGVLCLTVITWRADRLDRWSMLPLSNGGVDRIGWLKRFSGQCTAIGRYLADHAPPDASLATTAAGIIPYYSRLYTLDLMGINDEWVAHEVQAHGSRPGHTKSAPSDYVLKKAVDLLIHHPVMDRRPPSPVAYMPDLPGKGYVWKTVHVPGLDPPWWGYWERQR